MNTMHALWNRIFGSESPLPFKISSLGNEKESQEATYCEQDAVSLVEYYV
jgi:hypothetical protein